MNRDEAMGTDSVPASMHEQYGHGDPHNNDMSYDEAIDTDSVPAPMQEQYGHVGAHNDDMNHDGAMDTDSVPASMHEQYAHVGAHNDDMNHDGAMDTDSVPASMHQHYGHLQDSNDDGDDDVLIGIETHGEFAATHAQTQTHSRSDLEHKQPMGRDSVSPSAQARDDCKEAMDSDSASTSPHARDEASKPSDSISPSIHARNEASKPRDSVPTSRHGHCDRQSSRLSRDADDENSERTYVHNRMMKFPNDAHWDLFLELLCCGKYTEEEARLWADLKNDVEYAQHQTMPVYTSAVQRVYRDLATYLETHERRTVAAKLFAVHEYLKILLQRYESEYVVTLRNVLTS
jgi:hypothetical protein